MHTALALTLLEDAGTQLVCVDVGSAGGFHPRLRALGPRACLIGFEPDPDECARLTAVARPGDRYFNVALGRAGETVCLELHRKRTTSSIYRTDSSRVRHFDDAARLEIESSQSLHTCSLDDVARTEGLPSIDYLKVDVEGHELAVLEGFTGQPLVAEIEVTFHPFRHGVPLFDEVMRHMRERGMLLFDLRRTYWSPTVRRMVLNHAAAKGVLMFGDALFVVDPFLERNRVLLSSRQARAKYLALLCAYGYPAEALMIVDILGDSGLVEDRERGQLRSTISHAGPAIKRLRLRISRLLLMLERWFSLPVAVSEGLFLAEAAQTDGELGNWDRLKDL